MHTLLLPMTSGVSIKKMALFFRCGYAQKAQVHNVARAFVHLALSDLYSKTDPLGFYQLNRHIRPQLIPFHLFYRPLQLVLTPPGDRIAVFRIAWIDRNNVPS